MAGPGCGVAKALRHRPFRRSIPGEILGPAGREDDLTLTVDYGEAHRRAREIVEGEPVDLTETVAERIARALLADHPPVEAVRVKVSKPQVRLEGTVLAGSAVEILRRRE